MPQPTPVPATPPAQTPGVAVKAAQKAIAATVIPMRRAGFTFREIGIQLGITRQRAQQIWSEHEAENSI